MAHLVLPALMFGSVAILSGVATYAGATFTLHKVAEAAASAPVKSKLKPTYIAALSAADAKALDVARSVKVVWQPPEALQETRVAPAFTHTVAVESLRVRAGPKKAARQVFALKGGSRVTVIQEDRGWVLIDAGDGRKGWAYSKLLRPAEKLVASQD
ncbi:hypothetical protein ASC89_04390 [Devosia sp. Root413D1]|uniref:SH3 domain-containing protein n=1 Tax=Devosia sp. Root413D1 TaxID=1736531 RepID=UPI0006F568A8|nr:SH3 domain-containing protein [Devosia sp. Root413D1]KQW81076.1 hypothetical protein ASC89_04390 [Devosia sp. Root413D1]